MSLLYSWGYTPKKEPDEIIERIKTLQVEIEVLIRKIKRFEASRWDTIEKLREILDELDGIEADLEDLEEYINQIDEYCEDYCNEQYGDDDDW